MPEAIINNPDFLREEQYRTASNLNARLAIHLHFSTNSYGWARFVFDNIADLPADAHVLELGSGPATLWVSQVDRIPPGWHITLSDFSPGMVAEATAALAGAGGSAASQCTVRQIDIQAIPFADAHFDAVIANHMLYHVPDRRVAIGEVRRVLKPGGRFFAATNGEQHMAEQWQLGEEFVKRHGLPSADWHGTVGRTFSLENGAAQLEEFFDHVEMRFYADALHVTEVEPLVRYFFSMGTLPEDRREDLRDFVAEAMQVGGGVIEIQKSTGLFVAW